MKKLFTPILIIVMLLHSCGNNKNAEITVEEMTDLIEYMASDDLGGRYPGTPEDSVLLKYIKDQFMNAGLKSFNGKYLQEFNFLSGIEPAASNSLKFKEESYIQKEDFYPFSFSSSGNLSAPVVFCGYGFEFSTDENSRNDYENLEIKEKWALIMRGEPENHNDFMERSRDRDKALLAMEKGAAGVLLVSGTDYSSSDDLETGLNREPEIDIPVLQVKRDIAGRIIQESGLTISEMAEKSIDKPGYSFQTDQDLVADIRVEKVYSYTANVVGYLEGKNGNQDHWMIIGAHHDHLGMGGKGSSSRAPDTIAVHNGADDNASGVATVIELAEYFSAKSNRPEAGLIFVSFGAEEKGLLGSRHFVENSPVQHGEIDYMINIDMLGRMKKDSSLQVGGTGTSNVGSQLIDSLNTKYQLNISQSSAGYGPSDHASFYTVDIPVYFFSTGAHQDYHTPFDDADSLNYDGLVLGTRFIADLVDEIDKLEERPVYQEAGPKTNTSRSFRNRITLGIMPDVSGESKIGMKVLAVTEGKPAYLGGMQKGDIITAIEGKEVSNVYDYMYRLNDLKAGDRIVVTVIRDEKQIELIIQL
ncbi:MAG: M20/M25/M40 family metallo-hydrolase [Bacteroidales bacterium]